ncbi:MAG TPA: type II secretion system F family protein [Candidatus Moranbacteria bacterium]|nr:type II secretion system F family protein [Candidatus Moranbacteria bacterium]HRZ33622.1 type II secretion system F family protein [Candidatus Moranbacteria bacterium]
MPKFIYTARDYKGELKNGEIISQNEKNLAQQLRSEGLLVTSIKVVDEKKSEKISTRLLNDFQTIPLREKLIFARNLGIMFASGITISRAIENLSIQTTNKKFKKILTDIFNETQSGKYLSEGLAKYPNVFGELFVNMVSVGEKAGNLDEVLKIVAVQLEKEHDLKSKIKGAMVYPAVILIVMIAIGILMLIFVLPKLIKVFEDMDAELPAITKFIISLSNVLRDHGLLVIGGLFLFIFFLQYFFRKKIGKIVLSWILINAPMINLIVKKINCARFSRIYSSLIRSGVGSVEALKIISHTLTNYYYQQALVKSSEEVKQGVSLSKFLSDNQNIFPIMVSQIVRVGEETGKTETVLMQLAEFYEDEIDQVTKNMSAIIEPVLMVLIGTAVGFFAVGMLQPMYSLMDKIK